MSHDWSIEEVALLRQMVIEGADAHEVGLALKRSAPAIGAMLELLGLSLHPQAKLEWCVKCASPRAYLDPKTGWCTPCTVTARSEAKRLAMDEEEERLIEEAEREADMLDKRRQRMREPHGANPRKGVTPDRETVV